MKVVLASDNPTKLASTKLAFSKFFPDETIEYVTMKADSGVDEQPMSVTETIQGAVTRAKNACLPEADFAVGIEGGMSFHNISGHEYGVELSWVCVYDCKRNMNEIASSAGFPVFPEIIKYIRQGKTLSEAMEIKYGLKNLGQKNGYIGWLSDDVVTRESSNFEAIFLALSSLLKEEGV